MSRCFPFPPPGYEKKAGTDDVDLLKKEKHREKKHKKEKKDKEKREGKEKKEKDQSDEKHKEKKEKKDKHRDKKKEKEKEKEKDRERDKVSSSNSVERPVQKEKDKSRSSILDEKRLTGQLSGYNGENRIGESSLGADVSDLKYVQELEKRVRNEDRGIGSQFTQNFPVTNQKKDEVMVHVVAKDAVARPESKEKSRAGRSDEPKLDGLGTKDDRRSSGNAVIRNLSETVQSREERSQTPLARYVERKIDGGADLKVKESSDKAVDKQKDKERDRKRQGKVKDQREGKSKEEKAKEKNNHNYTGQDKIKESKKDDILGALKTNSQHLLKDPKKRAVSEGVLKKRKESETNGFLHASESRSSKLPKQSVVLDPFMENGRIQEHSQISSQAEAPDVQRPTNDLKPVAEDRGPNGIIDPRPLSVPATHSLTSLAQIDPISRVPNRSPHRDLKYLKEVLTVPKMDDLPVLDDDQAWLFDTSHDRSRNSMVLSSINDEKLQVWGESLHIESADVYALPYVIPY